MSACCARKAVGPVRARAASLRSGRREGSLSLLALLADAASQLVALLVLARFADLGPPRAALLGLRLALRRVLALRAHLAAHAIAPFGAFLAFAGLARLLVRALCLGQALLASLRVFRFRAVEAPFAPRSGGIGRGLGEQAGARGQ